MDGTRAISQYLLCIGVMALALACPFSVSASGAESGLPDLVMCRSCHGENGIAANDQWPDLAGQNSRYLVEQSIRYRDGLRYDPNGLMVPWVKNLSDEAIRNIAKYYSRQPAAPANSSPAADIEKGRRLAERCIGCHGLGGSSNNETWPILAGQNAGYIVLSMQYYQQGLRQDSTGLMNSFAQGLSADDIKHLAAYYASLNSGKHKTETP